MRTTLFIFLFSVQIANSAIRYVRSTDGSDVDTGATWALAKATLTGAFTASAAGDTIYVSQVHAETIAAVLSFVSPGTGTAPCRVLCANDGAEPPTALATTATVTNTGTNNMNFSTGYAHFYGITFSAATGASTRSMNFETAASGWSFDACALRLGSTSTGSRISIGPTTATRSDFGLLLNNTTVQFSNTSQGIACRGQLLWRNTASAVTGASIPAALFFAATNGDAAAVITGVDLSALGSGKSLVDKSAAANGRFLFENCKLGASVAITTGASPSINSTQINVVNSDSADTNYRYYKDTFAGTIAQEATIVRTGGASDGTTTFSRKFTTSANSDFFTPLYGPWCIYWNETLSATTVAAEVVTDNVTLTDAEAWIETEYMGTSGFPLALRTTDRAASILATPASQTTSSETWTTTGLATPVKQTLSVSVTPAEKGWIRARAVLAKPSTTAYVCPKILPTSAKQYMDAPDGDIVNAPAAGGSAGEDIHGSAN